MTEKLGRAWVLSIAVCLLLAFGVAACGGSGGGETGAAEATASEEAAPAEPETGSSGSPSGLLAGLEPPSGAKLLDEKTSGDVVYQHYSTSSTPQEVEVLYGEEVEAAGWSLVESGGSGGGWGPYGGSDYGLTAKREDEYFDLQAGGEKGSTSYFEICATAGEGTREDCNDLSDESNTSSGGSESGAESEGSSSGGS
jgi:hypothetical protein